jgi:SAM-dependent methyltransferase
MDSARHVTAPHVTHSSRQPAIGIIGMNSFLRGVVRAVAETFPLPEPILEIGSYRVPGQEDLADLRPLFPGREYVGLDARPGPGVDLVGDAEELPLVDASVGTVLAVCTFEHVRKFWKAFEEVRRVLRPDGALLVACPFYFHVHDYPSDYWRFTPDSLDVLLEDYPSRIVGWHGPTTRPANVWSLAFREGRPPISSGEYDRYRTLVGRYARQPLPWKRRLRYQLGRLIGGRRPFAPYLDRERWDGRCVSPSVDTPTATSQTPQSVSGRAS